MEPANSVPKELGDFEIIRQLGRGGMGVVYEAQQKSLNRRVALKVLSTGLGLTAKAIQRFRREAETAAKLHHTNIVPIYATGEDGGAHYYAMELIDGPSLDHIVQQLRAETMESSGERALSSSSAEASAPLLPWVSETIAFDASAKPIHATDHDADERTTTSAVDSFANTNYFDKVATMVADVADALHHAHQAGVVHRDIKPSNLLLSSDGRLSLNDFGLARVLEQPGMTMSGEFVGSPLYMSPEQITAGRAPIDHRTDIYSLGATLYEMLTFEPPYPGRQRDQVIAQILHKEIVPPRRKVKKIPPDLETICLKSLDRDPDRRYQDAGQMADDLRRFVNRFAITARRAGPVVRTTKWIRRHPSVTLLLALLCAVSLVAGVLGFAFYHRTMRDYREQVEEIKEQVLLEALAGNYDVARSHVEEARKLDVAQGWIRLMEGEIYLLEGRYSDAIVELNSAQNLLSESTPAYAMLAIAFVVNGNEGIHLKMLEELQDMQCGDFEDFLLKGWAETAWMGREAIADLKKACELNPGSHAAKLLYAQALRFEAERIIDPQRSLTLVNNAIREIEAVNRYQYDNPRAFSELVLAQLVASDRHRELRDDAKSRECLRQAEEHVNHLSKMRASRDARYARLMYFFRIGKDEQALADFWQAVEEDQRLDSSYAVLCANLFYRNGDIDDARRAYALTDPKFKGLGRFVSAYIEMDDVRTEDDRRQLANHYLDWLASAGHDKTGLYGIFDWTVLRLLRAKEEATQVANRWRAACDIVPEPDPWRRMADYMRGDCQPQALLDDCDNERFDKCHAHFVIAIDLLADGKREQAAEEFREVLKTEDFRRYAYWWSHAFLERLNSEEDWLPWLTPGHEALELEAAQ